MLHACVTVLPCKAILLQPACEHQRFWKWGGHKNKRHENFHSVSFFMDQLEVVLVNQPEAMLLPLPMPPMCLPSGPYSGWPLARRKLIESLVKSRWVCTSTPLR